MHSNQQIHMSKFNPNADYTWAPDTQFIFTGNEYENIQRLVSSVMKCDEVGRVVFGMEVSKAVSRLFQEGIESGTITEKAEDRLVRPNSSIVSTTGETLITA